MPSQPTPLSHAVSTPIESSDQARLPFSLSVSIDYEKYLKALEHCEATIEQKREFINVMGTILASFVDMGFGIYAADFPDDSAQNSTLESVDMVQSLHTHYTNLKDQFNRASVNRPKEVPS